MKRTDYRPKCIDGWLDIWCIQRRWLGFIWLREWWPGMFNSREQAQEFIDTLDTLDD